MLVNHVYFKAVRGKLYHPCVIAYTESLSEINELACAANLLAIACRL